MLSQLRWSVLNSTWSVQPVPHSWSPVSVFWNFLLPFLLNFFGGLCEYVELIHCMIADRRVWDRVFTLVVVVVVVVVVGPPTPSILKLFPNFWWTLTGVEPLGQSLGFIDDQRLTADLDSKFSHAQMQLFLGTRAPGAEVKGRSPSTLDMQMISF